MVKYKCQKCGCILESPENMVGQQDVCPACKTAVIVPPVKHTSKLAIAAIVLLLCVVIVSAVLWFIFRDTWERDHRLEILQLCHQVIELISEGQNKEGLAKYSLMIELIGNRQLKTDKLRQVFSDAQQAAESAEKYLNEQRRMEELKRKETESLAMLKSLESQAQAFVKSGDFEKGINKYKQAIELIQKNKFSNQEFTDAIGRISQSKMIAVAELEKKLKADKERRKREEEERTMANIRTKIYGGAWVVKEAGNSETLRGLNIYVLKAHATNEQYIACLQAVLAGYQERIKKDEEIAASWLKDIKREEQELIKQNKAESDAYIKKINTESFDSSRKWYLEHNQDSLREANKKREIVKSIQELIDKASKIPPTEQVDMFHLYAIFPSSKKDIEIKTWSAICNQQEVKKVHTDVEGKYEVELQGGDYYLYAILNSSYSYVEWFIPVRVADIKGVKIDIHNENAEIIQNKIIK